MTREPSNTKGAHEGRPCLAPEGPPARLETAKKTRIVGIDLARGIALFAMMAVHSFEVFHQDGAPTAATTIAAGRAAATFAFVAGISLALITGGQRPVQGQRRRGAVASVTARALLISVLGFALGYTNYVNPQGPEIILSYYGLMFLLAIPLFNLEPRVLVRIVGVIMALAPLLLMASWKVDLYRSDGSPTFETLLQHPDGLAVQLLITGTYPVLAYMAYICAGLAVGRLDLTSIRVARWLFGGGLALALGAWFASSVLLFHLGGLEHLRGSAPAGLDWDSAKNIILWDPKRVFSGWWLANRAPHSQTTINMLHTLGCAMAVLGGALLVTRLPIVAWLLRPVAIAGSMALTFYSLHLLFLAVDPLSDHRLALYTLLVGASLVSAVVWRHNRGQGPFERLLSVTANQARLVATTRNVAMKP